MSRAVNNYEPKQTLVITLASLASAAARQSTAVNNKAMPATDVLVQVVCKLLAGTPASDKKINLYVFGSIDDANFTDNAGATDAAITLRVPTNLALIGAIQTPDAGALIYESAPIALAQFFGGVMPPSWGIVVENRTGLALDTVSNAVTAVPVFLAGG